MKRLLLPALCSALLASPAPAQIDTNSNGLADEWEKAWNNNSLFPPAFNPQADPDGDGWENLVEALAGTNPFNSQPPTGIISTEISVTPATYEPLPPGQSPPSPPPPDPPLDPFTPGATFPQPGLGAILLDPPVVTLTWPTIPGKTYRAHVSENLSTWLPASETFLGSGIHQSYETEPLNSDGTIPAKLFWRVETGDTDSDGDTLTDYEEIRRGLNPFSKDSDGDGIPDNTDPAPLVNSLQPAWDADSTDPAGGNLFASFNFTPNGGATGHAPDISGNTRHGTARAAATPTFHLPSATPPNAEGIAGSGLHCADTRHLAFAVKNPGINFQPVSSLSFWLKTKAADLVGAGQPIFSYAPKTAVINQIGNTSNPYAIRAYLRKKATGTGYEIVWFDWQNPGAVIRERWDLEMTENQLHGNWTNLTFVWQGGSGASQSSYWACYANGVKQTRTLGSTLRLLSTATNLNTPQDTFLLGAIAAGGNPANNQATVAATLKGSLDRVRLYTAALTAAQVMSIVSQDADNDGLWDSTEMSSSTWKDTNSNGRRDAGEIYYPNGNPLYWQPGTTDTDSDGLTDIFEQNTTRTIFHNHDTDGDLLPDGWEHQNGLNPLSADGIHGTTGNPDGDGVDNFDEWRFLSNPNSNDSDGDGVLDGIEIGQGSRPADPTDNGQAPPPEEKLTLKILVGDPSGSHSERWRVEAEEIETGRTVLRHASRNYGQMSTAAQSTFSQFKPGKAYRFKLRHAGTDPALLKTDPEGDRFPDYDWSLQISYKDAAGNFISLASPAQTEYLVIDPYNDATKTRSPDPPLLLAPEFPWGSIGEGTAARYDYRERVEAMSVIMLPLSITLDTNRDGKIDLADREKTTPGKPWRFWINDDNDSGATGGDDIPLEAATKDTNGYDSKINGVRDLVDFFPLDLDLKAALEIFPQSKYRYILKHDATQFAPCFKIVQARDLTPGDSDAYLKDLDAATALSGHESLPIHSIGRGLDSRFLDAVEDGTGLLLVEAIRPTTNPIKLQIRRNSDRTIMGEVSLPVSVTPSLEMIRWNFFSPGEATVTNAKIPADPPNWPDADRNGKHFVFVHGYNVNPEQSKAWATEAFKRMFWSGSNARFTAFAWFGYESQTFFSVQNGKKTPNYQVNLLNSFGTAKSFKEFLDLLEGEKTVVAHSMGNILVGSAMHDWGSRPKNYIMLNSAAAKECYDASEANDTGQDVRMVNPAWSNYPTEIRASEWHKLAIWPADDKRRTLTWKNRLRGVVDNGGQTEVYNFFSSGEEILNNPFTDNPQIDPANPFSNTELVWATGNKTWAMQEKRKGYGLTGLVHTSNYGGWLPNLLPYNGDLHVPDNGPWGVHRMRTPSELPSPLTTAWLDNISVRPFFDDSTHEPLFDSARGDGSIGSNYAHDNRNTIIAEMIPCTTFAAGRNRFNNPLTSIPIARNIDMDSLLKTDPARWPESDALDQAENRPRPWLHSDIKDKAFVHNWNAYKKFMEIGQLK